MKEGKVTFVLCLILGLVVGIVYGIKFAIIVIIGVTLVSLISAVAITSYAKYRRSLLHNERNKL